MQIGCGLRVMTIKNRRYLYFWHYETQAGRRRPVYKYMGPAGDSGAAREASDALEAYTRKAIEDARRWLQSEKAGAAMASRG